MSTEPDREPLTLQFWVVLALTALWLWQLLSPGTEPPSPTQVWIRAILAATGVMYLVATLLRRWR